MNKAVLTCPGCRQTMNATGCSTGSGFRWVEDVVAMRPISGAKMVDGELRILVDPDETTDSESGESQRIECRECAAAFESELLFEYL